MFESCPPFQSRQIVPSLDYSEDPTLALAWIERPRLEHFSLILSHESQLCLLGKFHGLSCLKAVRSFSVDKPFRHLVIVGI